MATVAADSRLLPASEGGQASSGLASRAWFTSRGRCGVLAYHARLIVVTTLLLMLTGMAWFLEMLPTSEAAVQDMSTLHRCTIVLLCLAMLTGGVYSVLLGIQRLHDLNISGWFTLLALLPIVGLVFTFYLLLMPGKAVANRFGDFRPATLWEKGVGMASIVLSVLLGLIVIVRFAGLA